MIVKDYIDTFSLEHEHAYDTAVILKWINLAESNLDVVKNYKVQKYARVSGEYQFDLPAGVEFEDVKSIRVCGIKYIKKDVREYNKPRSFWLEDGKLCIYPTPTETDEPASPKVRLVYLHKAPAKTMANIETDTLLLPERFIDVYDFFIMSKIAYLQKEYAEQQNHMVMYNAAVRRFEDWYSDHRPQNPDSEIVAGEYDWNGHDTESDFA